ncbi:unnamed protein product, partial [Ceratitis capitata]
METENQEKKMFNYKLNVAYRLYFNEPALTNKHYTPITICKTCYTYLLDWMKGRNKARPRYVKPVTPNTISETCYTNLLDLMKGRNKARPRYVKPVMLR